jgi:iron complex outermembrane receptor protein
MPVIEDTPGDVDTPVEEPVDGSPVNTPEDAPANLIPDQVEELEEIVVEGSQEGPSGPMTIGRSLRIAGISIQPVTSVSGDELMRRAQGTLGETLAWEPGVTSNYFGPAASRPVIRGFDGVRVKMMRDDLSTMDLSDTSPDHGVTVDPLLAESLEIHRGPAALLYGNSAIGGAVNTRSRTLARELPPDRFNGSFDSRFETASQGWAETGWFSLKHGSWVLQLTGSIRESEDIHIPGNARTAAYDAQERPRVRPPGGGPGSVPVGNPDGRLLNTFHESTSYSIGLSYLPEGPFWMGISYSYFDSLYGLPYIYSGDATDPLGDSIIDMRQRRFDLEMGLDLELGPLKKLQVRLAQSDYMHDELFQGRGADADVFYNETALSKNTVEGRVDLMHGGLGDRLEGVVGMQSFVEDFDASRLVVPPPTEFRVPAYFYTENQGLYLMEKLRLADWQIQWGSRWEQQRIVDDSLAGLLDPRLVEEECQSHSLGITWGHENILGLKKLTFTGIISDTQRMPTATERYAFWSNAAMGRFLVGGDMDGIPLRLEKSMGYELGVAADLERVSLRVNAFKYDYENFIFLQEITNFINRAVQYIEREATLTGWEAELEWRVWEKNERQLKLTLMGDSVRGHNDTDDEPLPRMPAGRFGARLEYHAGRLSCGLEARHSLAQDRLKPEPRGELPTDACTLVNADVSWRLTRDRHNVLLTLQATNLLNEEARVHTSFRKDVAPLPGIGVSASVRWSF